MLKLRGFTLIEILVVILIISITLGFAMLAFGDFGEKRSIVTAAQQFANYVTLVRQEAILESTTLGIHVNQDGYDAMRFKEPNTWQPMSQHIFHHKNFPKRTIIHFKTKTNNPSIIVNASGDMTAFELSFGSARASAMATVMGKSDGYITVNIP